LKEMTAEEAAATARPGSAAAATAEEAPASSLLAATALPATSRTSGMSAPLAQMVAAAGPSFDARAP
jgi:hypothetical protein